MSYAGLIDWMFNLERFGIKLGLENISEFMKRIGDPQRDFKSVHVAGTNGKGSVCAMVSEIMKTSGLKVGIYTSPHLVDFRERIAINGKLITETEVERIASELRTEMDSMAAQSPEKQLTFFEFTTGLAFRYFSDQKVDLAVAEVGMGGRLDATNVLFPEVAAITRIGLEHTNYLGDTLAEIAREKAGIIKEGATTVTCEKNREAFAVIRNVCSKKHADLMIIDRDFRVGSVKQSISGTVFDYSSTTRLPDLETRLIGRYQAENAAAAIAVCEELARKGYKVNEEDIRKGLMSTAWPGRLDFISREPLVILDGSHNPDGVRATISVLQELKVTPLTFVLGCMDDKDAHGIARALSASAARIICTQAANKRALPAERLATLVKKEYSDDIEVTPVSREAFESAMKLTEGRGVCVIGSLYLVGEAIQWWNLRSQPQKRRPHNI